MLDQIKVLLKKAEAQKYVPPFGPKASDPVETAINKAKRANVKPQEPEGSKFRQITKKITAIHGSKPPLTKISEFMSSDVFVSAFLGEMDKVGKRRLSGLGALLLGAGAGVLAPTLGPATVTTIKRGVVGAGKGIMAGPLGVTARQMPKLPGQHEINVAHGERITAAHARKMKAWHGADAKETPKVAPPTQEGSTTPYKDIRGTPAWVMKQKFKG